MVDIVYCKIVHLKKLVKNVMNITRLLLFRPWL